MIPRGQLRDRIQMEPRFKTEARLRNIDIIEHLATGAGMSLSAAAGMVANAWAESRLDEEAHDGGSGWGLFQLTSNDYTPSTSSRMRKGSISQRKDPLHNTRYMLNEAAGRSGFWFRDADSKRRPPSELAYIFGRDLERCARCGDRHYGTLEDGVTPDIRRNPYRPAGAAGFSSLQDRAETAALFFPDLESRPQMRLASIGGTGSFWDWAALAALGVAIYNVQSIEDKIKGKADVIW